MPDERPHPGFDVHGHELPGWGGPGDAEEDRDWLRDRLAEVKAALEHSDDLLRRLDEWDVMRAGGYSDGPFWRRQIAEARERNRAVLNPPKPA